MKILFLTDNFPPEVNAPATRTYEHCCEWVKAGHEVTVITCFPNYPTGKVYQGYKNSFFGKAESMNGIKVVRVWSYMTANKGFAKRILDFIKSETRYARLVQAFPDKAAELFAKGAENAKAKYERLQKLSTLYGNEE